MREPIFRGVDKRVHRRGLAGLRQKEETARSTWPPTYLWPSTCTSRWAGFYKIWEVGKPPEIVWEFGSASTAKGTTRRRRSAARCLGCWNTGCTPPQPVAQGRRQGFRLEDGS